MCQARLRISLMLLASGWFRPCAGTLWHVYRETDNTKICVSSNLPVSNNLPWGNQERPQIPFICVLLTVLERTSGQQSCWPLDRYWREWRPSYVMNSLNSSDARDRIFWHIGQYHICWCPGSWSHTFFHLSQLYCFKFYIWHNGCDVVPFATICSDLPIRNVIATQQISHWILIGTINNSHNIWWSNQEPPICPRPPGYKTCFQTIEN